MSGERSWDAHSCTASKRRDRLGNAAQPTPMPAQVGQPRHQVFGASRRAVMAAPVLGAVCRRPMTSETAPRRPDTALAEMRRICARLRARAAGSRRQPMDMASYLHLGVPGSGFEPTWSCLRRVLTTFSDPSGQCARSVVVRCCIWSSSPSRPRCAAVCSRTRQVPCRNPSQEVPPDGRAVPGHGGEPHH